MPGPSEYSFNFFQYSPPQKQPSFHGVGSFLGLFCVKSFIAEGEINTLLNVSLAYWMLISPHHKREALLLLQVCVLS